MKILIVSDTHKSHRNLERILKEVHPVDLLILFLLLWEFLIYYKECRSAEIWRIGCGASLSGKPFRFLCMKLCSQGKLSDGSLGPV